MKICFIDLEFSLRTHRLMSVGGLSVTDGAEKKLYQIIRQSDRDHIREDMKFMHICKSAARYAVPFNICISLLSDFVKDSDRIVIWGSGNCRVLKGAVGYGSRDRIVELQSIVEKYIPDCSLKKMTDRYDIPQNKPHHALEDCHILRAIYENVLKEFPTIETDIVKALRTSDDIAAVIGRDIFHRTSCRYLKDRSSETLVYFEDTENAVRTGLRPCKYCHPELIKKTDPKKLKKPKHSENSLTKKGMTDDELFFRLEKYANSMGISCIFYGSTMYLTTTISSWFFDIFSEKIKLHHNNSYRHKGSKKFGNDYHVQKRVFTDPFEVVRYIYFHDKNKYRNPPAVPRSGL